MSNKIRAAQNLPEWRVIICVLITGALICTWLMVLPGVGVAIKTGNINS